MDRVVEQYGRLVGWASRRWGRPGHPILSPDDLAQAAWEAVVISWQRYQHLSQGQQQAVIKKSLYNKIFELLRRDGNGIRLDLEAAWAHLQDWEIEEIFFSFAMSDIQKMVAPETWSVFRFVFLPTEEESRERDRRPRIRSVGPYTSKTIATVAKEVRLAIALLCDAEYC